MVEINKKIEFRRMNPDKALEEHVNKQIEKLQDFFHNKRGPISIDVVLERHPDHAHDSVAVRISVPMYETTIDIVAYREGPELYDCINQVFTIAHRDLMQAKQKLVDMKKVGKE